MYFHLFLFFRLFFAGVRSIPHGGFRAKADGFIRSKTGENLSLRLFLSEQFSALLNILPVYPYIMEYKRIFVSMCFIGYYEVYRVLIRDMALVLPSNTKEYRSSQSHKIVYAQAVRPSHMRHTSLPKIIIREV